MPNAGVTAHMVVKNEDVWVWFAIQSVLPHVDHFLITDTGSTDKTVEIIRSINSPKIEFNVKVCHSPADVTKVREAQIKQTKTPWIWVVDGDEIYTEVTAKEVVSAIGNNKYDIVVVKRLDLLGDVYHRQVETVGTYNLFGKSGHLLVRLLNKDRIKNLHIKGDYPLEGYFENNNASILEHDVERIYFTKHALFHTMYLRRSSLGSNLSNMFNRSKYKIETGVKVVEKLPEIFSQSYGKLTPNPFIHRSLVYEIIAFFITPIKNFVRKYL